MRLRSSGGYDADDVAPQRVGDKEHAAVDQPDGVEPPFARSTMIVEFDHIRVQEYFRGGSEVDAVLFSVGSFLGGISREVHCRASVSIY